MPGDHAFWRRQADAVMLLLDLERALAGMEATGRNVTPYLRSLPAWYRAVFSYEVPWKPGQHDGRPLIQDSHMDMLDALADALSEMGYAAALDEQEQEAIGSSIGEAEALIKNEAGLSIAGRRYMLGLIQEARACLADLQIVGTTPIRRATFELNGAMCKIAIDIHSRDAEKASRWFTVATRLLGRAAATVAMAGLTAGAEAVAGKAIDHL